VKRLRCLALARVVFVGFVPSVRGGSAPAAPAAGGAGEALPEGHPPVPRGHPPLSGMTEPLPPDAKGTLVVRAIQGTRDGPAVAGGKVTVLLVHRGRAIKQFEATLDPQGKAVLADLPVGAGVHPLVRIEHGGVMYESMGPLMHAGPPDHQVQVVVYESTEQRPPLVLRARHMVVSRTPEGLYVKEMMILDNPTDRAWVGTPDAEGRTTTLNIDLPIPETGGRVDFFQGFDERCTRLLKDRLINTHAIAPGKSQFVFGYLVPIRGGRATLEVVHPAATDQIALVVPESGMQVEAGRLGGGESLKMGPGVMRLFKGEDFEAGGTLIIRLTGIAEAAPSEPQTKPAGRGLSRGGPSLPQTIAAAGGGAILVGGIGLMWWKRSRTGRAAA
jgi:hypothetical protein